MRFSLNLTYLGFLRPHCILVLHLISEVDTRCEIQSQSYLPGIPSTSLHSGALGILSLRLIKDVRYSTEAPAGSVGIGAMGGTWVRFLKTQDMDWKKRVKHKNCNMSAVIYCAQHTITTMWSNGLGF